MSVETYLDEKQNKINKNKNNNGTFGLKYAHFSTTFFAIYFK
jgi:hypothetical protein